MSTKYLYPLLLLFLFFVNYSLQKNALEPLASISLRFDDTIFTHTKKEINKDILFVAVDEPSVNTFGRWPWRRDIIAQGLEQLTQADIVLFDMIFSEPTESAKDQALSDAIAGLNNSVCGFFLRHKATQKIDEESLDILDDSSLDLLQSQIAQTGTPNFISAPEVELNIAPILESCSLSGSFSTLPDSDQLLRSYPISEYYNNKLFPSLAVQALRIKYQSDLSRVDAKTVSLHERKLHLDKRGFVKLNYYEKNQYEIISFLDLYNKKVKPDYFKDKIVIFGITEVGSGDVASTPIGLLYGPLLHYTFLSNFLQNQLIIEQPNFSLALMLLLGFLPLLLLYFVKKIIFRMIATLGVFLVILLSVRYLFVTQMYYIDLFYPLLSLILSTLLLEVLHFRDQENRSKFMRDAFSAYLSKELLDQLILNPDALTLGGEKKELSILFSDIRGFTTISESMDPASLVKLLNRYFTPMTESVLQHKGMLDKYIGDAVMAFFNAPVDVEAHAQKACDSALEMMEKLKLLNQELAEEDINPIRIGIGINTAEVVVGNMGSNSRFNYTVMGDGVNLASRIEGLTKNYGVSILITEFTVAHLSNAYLFRPIEPVAVKGKDEPVLLYELLENSEQNREVVALYDSALTLYKDEDFTKAQELFSQLNSTYNDSVSHYFLKKLEANEPWGVQKMLTK